MLKGFWLILQNTFLAFTLFPFSSGSYYKIGSLFFGVKLAFIAKFLGIVLALSFNFALGRMLRRFIKKDLEQMPKWGFLMLLLSFIPVISGFISFYFGLLKVNFAKFLIYISIVNFAYYLIAIYLPYLQIYF
jgi:membrane protein YqaA with SNARE-associated domain